MDIQKSKIIYAELKNGSTYEYLWLGNDHFADLYNSWDYEDNEGKYEGMLDLTIRYPTPLIWTRLKMSNQLLVLISMTD
jgi:hypothetical protein